ncbi:MAG: extracellular solute-binding protein [Clostridia bacterium]|nr:extracellular solute-binding protein [Clostridia bacterium]
MKKILCVLFLCFFIFCACDTQTENPISDSTVTDDPFAPSETAAAEEVVLSHVYQPVSFVIPDGYTAEDGNNKKYLFSVADTVYWCATCKDEDGTTKDVYLRYDLNGMYLDAFDLSFIYDNETIFLPKEQRTKENVVMGQSLFPLTDGNYSLSVYDMGKKEARMYLLDGTGTVLRESAPILPDSSTFFSGSSFYLGEDFFLLYNQMNLNTFWLFDRDLQLLGRFDTLEPIWDAFLHDGLPVVTFQSGQCIIYNEKTNTFDSVTLYEQTDAYKRADDMLYFDDAVYLVDGEAVTVQRGGEETVLLDWSNSYLSRSSVHLLSAFPDDRFVVLYDNLPEKDDNSLDICLLVPVETTTVTQQTITLAVVGIEQTMGGSYNLISDTINDFNRANTTYRVELTNYDKMFAKEGYGGGFVPNYAKGAAQFEEDLLAGVKYDMILFGTKYDGLSALQDKDLFMDISVAAENADLLPCLRGTASNTALPFSMSVSTLVAADTTVSSAAEFTWETLFALYEGLGDGETLFSTDVSEQLTVTMLSDYIDMDAAACTLDSPDFARAAEFIAEVQKAKKSRAANPLCDGNLGSLADGATSCFGDPVGSLQSGALKFLTVNLDMLDSLISVPYLFEEAGLNPVFCGYPTKQGGTLYATPRVNMTIPKTAANKAGAYAFLQYALSEEVQCSDGMAARAMPVTRAAYETQIQSGYFYIRVFAEELTNWMLEEVTDAPREQHTGLAEVHVTEEERAAMVSYFADTTARGIYDKTIRAIVDEELSAAASGVRSTEEAGAIMKNRVWIYLNE